MVLLTSLHSRKSYGWHYRWMIAGEEARGGWVVSVGAFSFPCGGGVGGGLSGVMVGLW